MRTAVLSDLHLGRLHGGDILLHAVPRARLLEVLGDIDRLVILGDVLELREVRSATAVSLARPLFSDLGEALPDGAEVVVVPGNHDHLLARPLVRGAARRWMSLEQTAPVDPTGRLGPLGEALAPVRLTIAYPGLWLRPDVYATHGHWLDAHAGGPRFENRVIATLERWFPLPDPATPRHYERVSAPLYRVANLLLTGAGRMRVRGPLAGLRRRARKERAREPRDPHPSAAATSAVSVPSASSGAPGRGSMPSATPPKTAGGRPRTVQAMIEVVQRLRIDARHVVFGHTHRAGPLSGDDRDAWRASTGTRLVNLGSWVYAPTVTYQEPGRSPYWPGRLLLLDEADAPRLVGLLDDLPAERWKEPGAY